MNTRSFKKAFFADNRKRRIGRRCGEVTVSGEQVESHPRVFPALHIEYIITGDVNEKAVQRAIDLSENIYCPAQAMLRAGASITSSYRIIRP